MSSAASHATRRALAGAVALALAGACSNGGEASESPTATGVSSSTTAPLDDVALHSGLDTAIAWLAAELPETDAFTLAFVDYVGRRYGIAEFAEARALAQRAAASERPETQPDLRLVFPDARVAPEALTETGSPPGFLLVRGGLACDEPGSPEGFDDQIRAAIDAGGYDLTHAGLALGIERDLGCAPTGGTELRDAVVAALVAEAETATAIDDLAAERLAVLVYLGAADRVTNAQIAAVIDAQQGDGSIAAPDPATARHLMTFAVWVLADAANRNGDPTATLVT